MLSESWSASLIIFSVDSKHLIFEKWAIKQRTVIKVLSLASKGNLISWKGKTIIDKTDYITTHDYYDKDYGEAMLDPAD